MLLILLLNGFSLILSISKSLEGEIVELILYLCPTLFCNFNDFLHVEVTVP